MHSKQTKEILSSGTRIMCISDEHPDILARLKPDLSLKEIIRLDKFFNLLLRVFPLFLVNIRCQSLISL